MKYNFTHLFTHKSSLLYTWGVIIAKLVASCKQHDEIFQLLALQYFFIRVDKWGKISTEAIQSYWRAISLDRGKWYSRFLTRRNCVLPIFCLFLRDVSGAVCRNRSNCQLIYRLSQDPVPVSSWWHRVHSIFQPVYRLTTNSEFWETRKFVRKTSFLLSIDFLFKNYNKKTFGIFKNFKQCYFYTLS